MNSFLRGFGFSLAFAAQIAFGADLDAFADRDALLRPAPNPAWSQFSTAADHYGAYEIGAGVYLFVYRGTNGLFMVTDEGVIVVDPISEEAAPKFLAAIRAVTDAPIKYLVYSHWHWDHIQGGQVFKDAGATIIAHEKCIAPLGTWVDYSAHHWVRTLKETEAMDLDFIMSGHAVPVAHPSAVTERRRYLESQVGRISMYFLTGW